MTNKSESKGRLPGVGAKLPHHVYAELIKLRDSTGKSESQLIGEAIAQYLGVDAAESVPDRLNKFEATLAELQQQVSEILGKFKSLAIR